MPKCTIDGREIEVAPGTNALTAALDNGIHIQHFCWHPDLPVDGNCRTCMIEVEKMPKLQIACNTVIAEGMVIHTKSPKAVEAQRTALEFLLVNHPIDCPVCDQAGECYLQDSYMRYGLYDSKVEIEEKVKKRKVVDLGPIMLDAERCVLCSRCLRFENVVTGTNSLEFQNRGDHTQISSFENRPITHAYAGNLADVCPVGALLSHDFRFKMRVWFLKETESVCPGCSTGCNIFIDQRDDEAQRIRPRRNPEVNKSWMCDPGRALYKEIAATSRVTGARLKGPEGWHGFALDPAVAVVAEELQKAGAATAFVASPQASNEDLFAFRRLAEAAGGRLDFRVGSPQERLAEREDAVLRRADHNPNTQGCLDLGLARDGVDAILEACRREEVRVLVLQGPELLRRSEALDAIARVPFVVVMATHEGPELERAHAVLPAAVWAEYDGTFTSYARRLQRFRRAVAARGDAQPRFEICGALLRALGHPLDAATARDVFALLARDAREYSGLDYRKIGALGLPLSPGAPAALAATARA
jgi:NADH-quinone oxidoreductase subunit G